MTDRASAVIKAMRLYRSSGDPFWLDKAEEIIEQEREEVGEQPSGPEDAGYDRDADPHADPPWSEIRRTADD